MYKTNRNPFVSVIIPTYNRAWILNEAIESVLAQDFKDFELTIVDDGSTDSTRDLLAKYEHTIRIIKKDNGGVSSARNSGIRSSKGDLIAFLDSDDLWLPRKLSNQVNLFRSNPHILISQTEEIWIRNGKRVNPGKRHQKVSGMIFENSLDLCLVSPSAVMMHRKIFDDIGLFDENLPACEDYDLWLRISSRYPVHLIDTPLIIKRGGHDDQLSKMPGLDKYRISAIKKIIDDNRLSKDQLKAAVNVLIEKCKIYSGGCLKRGRNSDAAYYTDLAEAYRIRQPG